MDAKRNRDLPRRWHRAWYRGPSMEVPDGHLLLREGGGLVIAKGLKAWVQEPHLEEPPLLDDMMVDDGQEEPAAPMRRYRSKASLKPMMAMEPSHEELGLFEELDVDDIEGNANMCAAGPSVHQIHPVKVGLAMKKAEVQYTENVEGLLQELDDCGRGLEVTHKVSLEEVKRSRQAWFAAAEKEYVNLKDGKRAFTTVRRSQLRVPNCSGQGGVHCQPDKSRYRRKARFVDQTLGWGISTRTELMLSPSEPCLQ